MSYSFALASFLTFAKSDHSEIMEQKEKAEEMKDEQTTEQQNEALNEDANVETTETETEETLSPEEKLAAEAVEWKDKYARLYAEFDNFRKRTSRERVELIKSAGSDVISEMLPVLDDFDRAMKANETNEDIKAVKEGFNLIRTKLNHTLEGKGLKAMNSMEQPFDTEYHEAITNIPAPSDHLKGKVVDVVTSGYFLNDTVLRYAQVVVGQ